MSDVDWQQILKERYEEIGHENWEDMIDSQSKTKRYQGSSKYSALKNVKRRQQHGVCERCGRQLGEKCVLHHHTYDNRYHEHEHLDDVSIWHPECHENHHNHDNRIDELVNQKKETSVNANSKSKAETVRKSKAETMRNWLDSEVGKEKIRILKQNYKKFGILDWWKKHGVASAEDGSLISLTSSSLPDDAWKEYYDTICHELVDVRKTIPKAYQKGKQPSIKIIPKKQSSDCANANANVQLLKKYNEKYNDMLEQQVMAKLQERAKSEAGEIVDRLQFPTKVVD
jgi:hypothetical protein